MSNMISDKELLQKYQMGDNECISIIYVRYLKLFKVVTRKYLCSQDAEDVIQTIIEKLLTMKVDKRIQQFEKINSIERFLYKIARNASIDYLRKMKIQHVSIDYADMIESTTDEITISELNLYNIGLSKMETIYMKEYLNGKKPREISLIYSTAIQTIKNTLSNAKKKMIQYYKTNNHLLE